MTLPRVLALLGEHPQSILVPGKRAALSLGKLFELLVGQFDLSHRKVLEKELKLLIRRQAAIDKNDIVAGKNAFPTASAKTCATRKRLPPDRNTTLTEESAESA